MNGYVVKDRWSKYKYSLTRFAHVIERDFDKLTKEDCREVAGIIAQSQTISVTTKEDILGDARRAMKYLFGDDEDYPDFVKTLKLPRNAKQKGVLRLPKKY